MFEHYIHALIKPLPFSGDGIKITVNGEVLDREDKPLDVTVINNRRTVSIDWISGYKSYDVGVLTAFTFKGKINLPHYYIDNVDVMFADGDPTNLHPSNLVWQFPPERLLYRLNTNFAYIPGLTDYAITKTGVLINVRTKKELTPHFDKKYAKFKLVMDTGHLISIGRHRLVSLAWKVYPHNVDTLVVNHIDGIPGNDWEDNLELVPRAKNNKHALEHGLLSKGRHVLVRDVKTGIVTEYSGTSTCGRELGLNRATVRYRLEAPNQPVWFGGIQMKYKRDDTPWRDVHPDELDNLQLNKGVSKEVFARDIHTGQVTTYPSVQDMSRVVKVPVMTIHGKLHKQHLDRPINGYDFSFKNDDWREYTDEELFIFSHSLKGRITACYLLDVTTNEKQLYPSRELLAKELGVSSHWLYTVIRDNKLIKGKYSVSNFC